LKKPKGSRKIKLQLENHTCLLEGRRKPKKGCTSGKQKRGDLKSTCSGAICSLTLKKKRSRDPVADHLEEKRGESKRKEETFGTGTRDEP